MNPLAVDLDHILHHTGPLWDELRGQRIFVTGGTGFFGCWLLESFAWANAKLALEAEAIVLTRDPAAFERKVPHLANDPAIRLHSGNVQSFGFPDENCSHVLHAATETGAPSLAPIDLFNANVTGTRRVLEFVRKTGARKLLFVSSGAVYGQQPPDLSHISEEYSGAPSTLDRDSAYGQSKRASEFLCGAASENSNLAIMIARCFAFVGPRLPLNRNFAIGNFIADASEGRRIQVNSDGTPCRSYLYAADLAIWLWTILFRGKSGRVYNVGSDASLTIASLASLVAETLSPGNEVIITQSPDRQPASRYVPSIDRARAELGLEPWIDLREAIRRTANWNSIPNHGS
jgi:nucleoside-diphosphate-sugar epimerase